MSRLALLLLALVACTKETRSSASSTAASIPLATVNQPNTAAPPTTEPSAAAAPAPGAPTVNPTTPLILTASTLPQARLENASAGTQHVLHSLRFQPTRLRLYSANGTELPAEDERDTMKFDSAVRRDEYRALAPGGHLPLFSAKISGSGNSYDLVWGPFAFGGLKPGAYDAILEWESSRSDYTDDAGTQHRLPGVWQGLIRSPRFKVTIP
jgi:hypothetical protein